MATDGLLQQSFGELEKNRRLLEQLHRERKAIKQRVRERCAELILKFSKIQDDALKETDAEYENLITYCNNRSSKLLTELRHVNISEENNDLSGLEREVRKQSRDTEMIDRFTSLTSLSCNESAEHTYKFYSEIVEKIHDFNNTGCQKCGHMSCCTCKEIIHGSKIFKSNRTGTTYPIADRFTCNSSNVIYLISCREPGCLVQYVGKSESVLRQRMNGHRGNQLSIDKHFQTEHPGQMQVTVIDDDKHSPDALRDREDYWIRTLQTLYDKEKNPHGRNAYNARR